MAAEVWLIAVTTIVAFMLLGMSFVLMVYYSHPDDRNVAYVPKLIVVLSITLAEISVILIALDVANLGGKPGCNLPINFTPYVPPNSTTGFNMTDFNATDVNNNSTGFDDGSNNFTAPITQWTPACGGLNTATMWVAVFIIIAVFVALILPFYIFFYEAHEVGRSLGRRTCEACQYQIVVLAFVGTVFGVMFYLINTFSYPVLSSPITAPPVTCVQNCMGEYFNPNTTLLVVSNPSFAVVTQSIAQVPNSFGIYIASFMSFVGWFLFSMYTGIGLVTLPLEMMRRFRYRPKYIPKDLYLKLRDDLKVRVAALMVLGERMRKERRAFDDGSGQLGFGKRFSLRRSQRKGLLEFKKEVEEVEAEYEDLSACHESWSSYNPLIPYFSLVGGLVGGVLSVCWILQIVLFVLTAFWPYPGKEEIYIPTYFLNDLMTWGLIYSGFSLLGVIFLAIFGLYLFACNLHGNFKVGLRFLIIEIHPMKLGGTYMSSFLVNMIMLLLQTPALVNFIAMAFANTIVMTDVDLIMNVMVRYTTFFVFFFENLVFIWMFLGFFVLAIFLSALLPNERKKNLKRLKKRMEAMEKTIIKKEKSIIEAKKEVRMEKMQDVLDKRDENQQVAKT